MSNINGDAGNNLLSGTDADDIIRGLAGNDTLNGLGGNDQLFGDDGNDVLDGGTGRDTLTGGAGIDNYYVDNPLDEIVEAVNGGTDFVRSSITWTLGSNVENLILLGGEINGIGNELNNFIVGSISKNSLFGGAGNDTLEGLGGGDSLYGGTGNDTYRVADTRDSIIEDANAGTDTVETIVSWTLSANVENLILKGSLGVQDEPINGTGNELNNTITGNDANNSLYGKDGNDTLLGQGGDDRIVGGRGNDSLTGGTGVDQFWRWRSATGIDTITDFQVGVDQFYISARGFGGGLVGGATLSAAQFTLGTAAADSSDRFIYNSSTGALFFDADGTGATAQVQIATFQAGLDLTKGDIYIF